MRGRAYAQATIVPTGGRLAPAGAGSGVGRHARTAADGHGAGSPQGTPAGRVRSGSAAGDLVLPGRAAVVRDSGVGALELSPARLPAFAAPFFREGAGRRAALGSAVYRRADDDLRGARVDDPRGVAKAGLHVQTGGATGAGNAAEPGGHPATASRTAADGTVALRGHAQGPLPIDRRETGHC